MSVGDLLAGCGAEVGAPDTAPEGDSVEVRYRTVAAIERAGYIVDRELWSTERATLCNQRHNDPPPKK